MTQGFLVWCIYNNACYIGPPRGDYKEGATGDECWKCGKFGEKEHPCDIEAPAVAQN